KALAQERARTRALEQQLAARADEQKALAQERARTQAHELELAVRGHTTSDRDRSLTPSPSNRSASTPLTPAPDKLVTGPLLASGKQVMPANHKSRTLIARPINVVLAVLLLAGGYLVGRLSAPDNDTRPARSLDHSMAATIVTPAPLSSAVPQQAVTA